MFFYCLLAHTEAILTFVFYVVCLLFLIFFYVLLVFINLGTSSVLTCVHFYSTIASLTFCDLRPISFQRISRIFKCNLKIFYFLSMLLVFQFCVHRCFMLSHRWVKLSSLYFFNIFFLFGHHFLFWASNL